MYWAVSICPTSPKKNTLDRVRRLTVAIMNKMQIQPVLPLSAEEKLFLQAHLLNAVEQAVLAVDLTSRIVFWNRFAEMLYGWTEAEVKGRLIVDNIVEDHAS